MTPAECDLEHVRALESEIVKLQRDLADSRVVIVCMLSIAEHGLQLTKAQVSGHLRRTVECPPANPLNADV